MPILQWSKSNILLHHGSKELQHFPEQLFQFGQCKQDLSLTKRQRRRLAGIHLPSIERKKKGKHQPRGATRHSNPLHLATLSGEHELMKVLIGGNAIKDIDARDGNTATALHIAAEQNDMTAVKILVAAGASMNLNDYETPLHCAIRMDHTEMVRYLIRQGASLETTNLESTNGFDMSMRKIVGNHKFAHGILRPITVNQQDLDFDGSTRKAKSSHVTQEYEKMKSMATWDHGQKLLRDIKNRRIRKQGAQKLSRLVLKEDLQDAKEMIGDYGIGCNEPDDDDYGRSALTYATMYSPTKTVKWLVKEAGAQPRPSDYTVQSKSSAFLASWPKEFDRQLKEKQEQTLLDYERATILRSYEANAKAGLHFLRSILHDGKIRYGHNLKSKIILSLRALEKCPLGRADDFVELGRIVRDLLPNSWGHEAWYAFQDATIAAQNKENMAKTFGGTVGGGGVLAQLDQQGIQGELLSFKKQQEKSNIKKRRKKRRNGRIPPPPPRDYSGMVSGPRYDKEYIPGL